MLKKLSENKVQIIHMLTTAMLISRIITVIDYFIKAYVVNIFRDLPNSSVTIVFNALTMLQLIFPIIILLIISLRTKKILGDDLKKEWVYFAIGVRLLTGVLLSIVPTIAMVSFTFVDMREMPNQVSGGNMILTWIKFFLLSFSLMTLQLIAAIYIFKKADKISDALEATEVPA